MSAIPFSALAVARPVRWHFAMLAAALGVFFALNLQGIDDGFYSDDRMYLLDNSALKELSFSELWKLFPNSAHYNKLDWGPLRDLVYKAVFTLFGETPLPFKLLNYVLYAWAVVAACRAAHAVLRAFDDVRPDHAARAALIAGALFAVHPTHIESLQAIWGMKDLLMAGFSLSAIAPFLRWLRLRQWQPAAACALLLACAGMSKGVSVALLAPLWLLAYSQQRASGVAQRAWGATRRLLPVAVLPLALFAVFLWASPIQNFYGEDVRNFTDRPLIILGGQTLIALVPYPLSISYAPYGRLSALYFGVGAAALGAAAWFAWRYAKKPDVFGFGALFFVLMLAPYLQLAPFNTTSMIGDRFGFTALLGLCIMAAAFLVRLPPLRANLVALSLILGWLALTAARTPAWKNADALYFADVRRTLSEPSKANFIVISADMKRVREITVQVARRDRRMLQSEADDLIAILGRTQIALSEPRAPTWDMAALAFYIRVENDVAGVYQSIYETYGAHPLLGADASTHFLRNKRYPMAKKWAEFALETPGIPPGRLAVAYKNIGIALAAQGDLVAAERALQQSLRVQPAGNTAACALDALARQHPGQVAPAITAQCDPGR